MFRKKKFIHSIRENINNYIVHVKENDSIINPKENQIQMISHTKET